MRLSFFFFLSPCGDDYGDDYDFGLWVSLACHVHRQLQVFPRWVCAENNLFLLLNKKGQTTDRFRGQVTERERMKRFKSSARYPTTRFLFPHLVAFSLDLYRFLVQCGPVTRESILHGGLCTAWLASAFPALCFPPFSAGIGIFLCLLCAWRMHLGKVGRASFTIASGVQESMCLLGGDITR